MMTLTSYLAEIRDRINRCGIPLLGNDFDTVKAVNGRANAELAVLLEIVEIYRQGLKHIAHYKSVNGVTWHADIANETMIKAEKIVEDK